MRIFLMLLMCFRVPYFCSKMPKIYNWSMDSGVHSVCFHSDFAIKTVLKLVWKCVTRSNILFICNTFCCWLILLSSLYIELALVSCTNPNNVHCFGTIFPNLNFVFASICATRTVHIQSEQYRSCSTVKQRRAVGAAPKTALWLWVREMTWYPYTRGVRGRMKVKQRWFKVTRELCSTSCSWRPLDWRIRKSFDVYTVTQSRSVVTSAENPAPKNSPQSNGELRNGHEANLRALLYQNVSTNGVI